MLPPAFSGPKSVFFVNTDPAALATRIEKRSSRILIPRTGFYTLPKAEDGDGVYAISKAFRTESGEGIRLTFLGFREGPGGALGPVAAMDLIPLGAARTELRVGVAFTPVAPLIEAILTDLQLPFPEMRERYFDDGTGAVVPQSRASGGADGGAADSPSEPAALPDQPDTFPLPVEGSPERLVYDLCRTALERGKRWPTIAEIASAGAVSRRQAARILAALRGQGLLKHTARSETAGTPS